MSVLDLKAFSQEYKQLLATRKEMSSEDFWQAYGDRLIFCYETMLTYAIFLETLYKKEVESDD